MLKAEMCTVLHANLWELVDDAACRDTDMLIHMLALGVQVVILHLATLAPKLSFANVMTLSINAPRLKSSQ